MIEGTVNSVLEAVITVPVSGPAGLVRKVEAVIDTGFGGILTLPPTLVDELRLPYTGKLLAVLADGSEVDFSVFNARVIWDDRPMSVTVAAAETTPLVGMALLNGHSLHVEVQTGGRVLIKAA